MTSAEQGRRINFKEEAHCTLKSRKELVPRCSKCRDVKTVAKHGDDLGFDGELGHISWVEWTKPVKMSF